MTTTMARVIPNGTAQGNVLSPVIWNLVFDDLVNILNDGPIKAVAYADDCVCLIRGRFPNTMMDIMQRLSLIHI